MKKDRVGFIRQFLSCMDSKVEALKPRPLGKVVRGTG